MKLKKNTFLKISLLVGFVFLLVGCGIDDSAINREQVEIDFSTLPQVLLQDFEDNCQIDALNRDKCEISAALIMETILRPIYQDQLRFDFYAGTIIFDWDNIWISVWTTVHVESMDFDYEVERIRTAVIAMKDLPTAVPIEFLILFDPADIDYQTHFFFINTHDLIGYDLTTYDFSQHFAEDGYYAVPD